MEEIKRIFISQVDAKYRAGQAEHGGNLWKKSGIIKNLVSETPDFVTYSYVLKDQLNLVRTLLQEGKHEEALKWVSAILSDEIEEVVE